MLIDGQVCNVIWFQHHKPGKGGAFVKLKCKNVKTGQIIEKTYRTGEKVTQAICEKFTKQYLYRESDKFVFMDTEDYTQVEISKDILGDNINYLIEGEDIGILMYEGEILDVDLPPQIQAEVIEAEPGVKGNTATGATKKVKISTGLELEVPLFIEQGEKIVVDTRTGKYVSRT